MKCKFLSFLLLVAAVTFNCTKIQAQVAVGTENEPLSVSVLEIIADYENGVMGGLRLPQLTETEMGLVANQIFALSSTDRDRTKGLVVFNTTTSCVAVWNGKRFQSLCGDVGPAEMDIHCGGIVINYPNSPDPSYKQGMALTPDHYITVPVTVTRRGIFVVTATTGNGYAFELKGNLLEVGDHVLTLRGQGSPLDPAPSGSEDKLHFRINNYEVPENECAPTIEVAAETNFATFASIGVAVNGTYVRGTDLNNTNTLSLLIDFTNTTAGTAHFMASADGMEFTGGGTYGLGLHTVVLTGTGKPTKIGDNSITITGYSGDPDNGGDEISQNTTIKVISRTITILGLGYERYNPATAEQHSARSIIMTQKNFGSTYDYSTTTNNSTYLVNSIQIEKGSNSNGTDLQAKINIVKPDIIIVTYDYPGTYMNSTSAEVLANYVDNGGVLIAFTEGGLTAGYARVTELIRRISGDETIVHNAISSSNTGIEDATDSYGKVYPFVSSGVSARVDSILAGPFSATLADGTLAGKSWGEDGGGGCRIKKVPNNTTALSFDTHSEQTTKPLAIVHNTKGFIWIGDGGFAASGSGSYTDIYPCQNINGIPAVKPYGGTASVHNSFFYANAIAWAIDYVNAHE